MSLRKKMLSFDEKRKRLSELFYEKMDFFQLKDLEKLAPKLKGIVSQTVREVLQSLVDDGLVVSEKIGTSNYFWSFPSVALNTRRKKIQELQAEVERTELQIQEGRKMLSELNIGREDTEEKIAILEELEETERQNKLVLAEIEKYGEMDPDLFDEKKKELERLVTEINTLTDNIFSIQSYCVDKFMIQKCDFLTQFGLKEDLDYL